MTQQFSFWPERGCLTRSDPAWIGAGEVRVPLLRAIPVVVLPPSDAGRGRAPACEHHANSYLTKPVDFGRVSVLLRDLGFYWLAWTVIPSEDFQPNDTLTL
jgi:hypothetical protein